MKRFNSKTTGVLSPSDLKGFKGRLIYWIFFIILSMEKQLKLFQNFISGLFHTSLIFFCPFHDT